MFKYFFVGIVLFLFVSCGFVEESNFIQNTGTVVTGGNNPPTLAAITVPTIFAGVTTLPIDANDINSGGDIDIDGEAVTYTCRYDNSIDGAVGAGIGDCTSLTNEDGSSPSFDPSTGIFSGWSPPLNTIGTAFEFEIVGTDPNAASSSVLFSGTVMDGSPSAWLQGTQTTSSTNINQAPFAIEWSSSAFDPVYFDHSTLANPEELRVNVAGNYFVSVTVPMTSAVQRACVQAEIRVNG
jgi:hypothetical protein